MLLHRSGHGSLVGSIDLPAFRGNGDADADLLLGNQIRSNPWQLQVWKTVIQ